MKKFKYLKPTNDALIAWAEMLEDMAKMIIIATVPALIILDTELKYGIIGTILVLSCAILLILAGLILRNIKHNKEEK